LVKYTRLYGVTHKRTEGQFETTWKELQEALPKAMTRAFCFCVSETSFFSMAFPLENRTGGAKLRAVAECAGSPASCFPAKHA